jgi:hypothetical protein
MQHMCTKASRHCFPEFSRVYTSTRSTQPHISRTHISECLLALLSFASVVPIQDYTSQSPHLVDQVFVYVCIFMCSCLYVSYMCALYCVRVYMYLYVCICFPTPSVCVLSMCVCVCFLRLLECDSRHDIKSHGLRRV